MTHCYIRITFLCSLHFCSIESCICVTCLIPQILQSRTERVLTAALQGGWHSTNEALQQCGLSAAVRDPCGRSLLHCAVMLSSASTSPRWSETDLQQLLQTKQVFSNALDYQGNQLFIPRFPTANLIHLQEN